MEAGLRNSSPPGQFYGEKLVERKSFHLWIVDGSIRILEKFTKGERSVSLSLEQAAWTCKSLEVLHSQAAGVLLRHGSISLCTRRNKFGHFVKLQTTKPEDYIFVPFGKRYNGLVAFAELLAKALNLSSPFGLNALPRGQTSADTGDRLLNTGNSIGTSGMTPPLSFAEIVRRRYHSNSFAGAQSLAVETPKKVGARLESSTTTLAQKDPSMAALLDKIYALELEVAFLRSNLRLESSFSNALLSTDPQGSLPSQPLAVATPLAAASYPISSKKMKPTSVVPICSDPTDDMCVDYELFFCDKDIVNANLTDLSTIEQSGSSQSSVTVGSEYCNCTNGITPRMVTCDVDDTVADLAGDNDKSNSVCGVTKVLTKNVECNSMIDNEIVSHSFSSDPVSMDNDATVSLYGKHDSLNLAISCETQFADSCTDEDPLKVIAWDEYEGVYLHIASGMRCNPIENSFYNWIAYDNNDLKTLYYEPVDGSFKLTEKGYRGVLNSMLLNEEDWDKDQIFSEKSNGYHPNLYEFFKHALEEASESSSL